MSTSNVTQKGQVTIPVALRNELGLKSGSKVRFARRGKTVTLELVEEPDASSLFGTLKVAKHHGIRDIDAALEKLRGERAKASGRRRK